MPHQLMIRMRLPLLLLAAAVVLAMSAGPAFAGEDDEPAPTPVPAQPTPIPVQPTPTPVPVPVVQAPSQHELELERELARVKKQLAKEERENAARPAVQSRTAAQRTPVVTQPVRAVQAVQAAQTVPSGGIQAGAGGTAPQSATHSSLPLGVAALVLTLLAVGGAARLTYMRTRR